MVNGKAWGYVSYPVDSRRLNAYVYLSVNSPASYNSKHLYYASLSGKFYCASRKGNSTSSPITWIEVTKCMHCAFSVQLERMFRFYIPFSVKNGGSLGANC